MDRFATQIRRVLVIEADCNKHSSLVFRLHRHIWVVVDLTDRHPNTGDEQTAADVVVLVSLSFFGDSTAEQVLVPRVLVRPASVHGGVIGAKRVENLLVLGLIAVRKRL